ncbi:B3/4 domain-containing protein [Peribacillus sp. SCS-26]|uniref:B3/B4 domain-containing protein n=1 Tax=Paraperibacillus marinus TaxID=3115295 RepID=UPI003906001B
MNIRISNDLSEKIPGFKAACIHYHNITVGPSPKMIQGRIQLFQESLFLDLQEKVLTDYEGIKEWRSIFKKAGTDPSRYRPSAEALFRRVKKQQFLPPIHSAIDINNFFSLKYEIPLGIYDRDHISGNVTIAAGGPDDAYQGLNGRMNMLAGMILARDENGPFGTPYVDSERTKVTENTVNALQIVYLKPSMYKEEGLELAESISSMFTQVHGGEAEVEVVTA